MVPCLAVHELLPWLESMGLAPSASAATRYWNHLRAHGHGLASLCGESSTTQPVFLYGDAAEYTKYADHLLGVYAGLASRKISVILGKHTHEPATYYSDLYIYI